MEFCPKRHAINFQNPAGEAFDDPGLGGTMLTNTTEIGTATLPRRRLTIPAPTDVSPSAPRQPPRFPALAQFASAARRVPRAPIPVAFALAVLAVLATVAPEPAAAQTVTTFISNTGQTTNFASSFVQATEFTTGTGTYTLSSVGIFIPFSSLVGTPAVKIYGDTGGNPGTTLLATMTNPGTFADNAVHTFTAPANTTLSASTTYWVVTSNSAATNGQGFRVGVVGNTTLDTGAAAGWSIGAARLKSDIAATSWTPSSRRIRFAIRGTGGTTTNNPPTVATAIPDQSATAGTAFSYAFPDTTFSDADTGDTLSYTATKTDDTDLPLWLAFAASTRTFSGTPQAADIATVAVKVTASDGNGGSVSDAFDITVSAAADTTPPTLTSADVEITDALIINLVFSEDLQLSNRPALSAFTVTVDGSAATVSSVLVPGSVLPQNELWLQLSTAIRQRQAVVVTYTDATSGDDTAAIQDTAGNDAATFTTGMDGVPAVTNNSTVTNTVPADWSLIPTGLSTGDKFRLLFLSSTKRTASSTDIADYNTFIQTRAAAGHTDIQDYSAAFRAVGCTAAVDARDNTATTYTTTDKGVPIYWLNGAKAADQYEDFYDGSWDDEANDKNESGTDAHDTSQNVNWPWTGCDHDGTEAVTGVDSFALGTNIVDARVGRPNFSLSGYGPLNGQTNRSNSQDSPLYGLSEVFQVAAAVVVTNNPPTVANAIPDQSATAGTAFSYVFPANTFSDADTGDTLSYTATKTDDTALPTWLAFTASTRTFSGTPTAAETVSVKVTASDGNGGSVSDTFDITVAADTTPPTLTGASIEETDGLIINLRFSEDLQLSNPPPVSAFTVTVDGSAATVSSVLVPGSVLPQNDLWLQLSTAIRQGQAVVVAYADPTTGDDANAIQDAAGNDAADFTTGMNGVPAVTNNSLVTNTPATGAPTITGTAQVGQTLTAGTTAIVDADGLTSVSYTYQWIRVATDNTETNISGATASTYTLVAADQGTTIKVRVSFTDDASNAETLTSAATAAVSADTTPPTLISATVVPNGSIMLFQFSENLDGSNRPPVSAFTVTAGGNTITNSSTSQVPGSRDGVALSFSPPYIRQGQTVVLTYTDPTGGNDANAIQDTAGNDVETFTTDLNSVPAVINNSTLAPVAPGAPTGLTATASGSTQIDLSWTAPADNGGRVITGYKIEISPNGTDTWTTHLADTTSTNTTYAHTGLAASTTRHYRVSAINTIGTSAASNVDDATTGAGTNTAATGAPTITGTAQVGQTLTAGTTAIMDAEGLTSVSYTYQWIRTAAGVDTNISGATASTYTLVAADLGTTIKVTVSFTDDASNAETLTSNVSVIIARPANTAATGKPGITGTAQVGQTLTATVGTSADVDGLPNPFLTDVNTSFQWIRVATDNSETNIASATASTYTLVAADLGTTIKVKVGFADYYDYDETLTSDATAAVAASTNGICSRTQQVRDAIVGLVSGVTHCADVTDAHLAAITGPLNLGNKGITALAAGDFDGLTALTTLYLNNNSLTTLPAGVFDELTALTELDLGANDLTTLPAGVFDGLTALTVLRMGGNSLATLPAGVFDELTALTGLYLGGNSLSTLPAGVFEDLTALTLLQLRSNPGAPFSPTADALPDDGTVLDAGGDVTLDGSGSDGGPWGTNVTYSWAASGAAVTFDDAASATPVVTIPALTAGTELTFTLTVTGRATDTSRGTAPDTDNATVTATATDAAPAFTSSATFSAAENQTAAGTVEASDSDAGDSVTGYEIQGGADRSKFSIGAASGVLTFRSAPNFEDATDDDASNTYVVVVRATSGTGARAKTADQTITVTVTDVDGEAPGVPGAPTVASASVSSLTAAWAAPANAGPPITDYDYRYQVKSTPGWTEVTNTTITALSATITELAEDTEYEVQVRATNDEGTSGWSDPGSASTDANAAPAFTSSATFSAAENQTAAGTVEASDSDAGDSVTGYEIQGGADRSKFSIGAASGVLTFRSAPNFEDATDDDASNTYVVVVRATSGTGARAKTADQTITVTVTDVDGEAPGVPGAPTVASASVSSLTAAWAAPANAGPPITDYDYRYQVKSTPGWTEVTNTTITALSATITELAEDTEYEVQVRATNDEGTSGWSDPGSASTDANAAPAFTSSATFSAAENQTAAGTVEASDSDAGDSVTGYEIQGGADRSKFSIGAASGVLTFRSAPNFEDATDDDASNTYVVVVRATSGTGARAKTADQTITVTVTDVDGEAPGVPGAPTVASASVSSLTAAWAAPANAGPPITDYDYRYQVKSTPGWTEVTNTTITALSATITELAEDTEYEVQVRATNDEGTSGWSDSGSASTDANAAPAFTSSATFSAAENQTAAGTVEASDSDAGDSVTGYEIQGGADRSKFSIGAASGVLTFRSAPNFEDATDDDASNTYVVVVRATSGTGARAKTADQTITVTVTDVDGEAPGVPGAPTVASASVSSLTAAWAAPANAGPPITDYDYRYQVKSTPGWTEVTNTTITALSATITELAEDTEYEVQVRATNDEGTSGWSDSGSASTDANAAPAFTSSATFSAAENQTAAGTVEASDSDAGDSVTGYEIQGGADRSKFSIGAASGVLTFRSAPNFEDATDDDASNTYVVVVRATSGTGARAKTADQTITVTVTDVDGEAPGVPGAPTVASASVSSLTAAWAAPANAGPPITDYDYRYQVKSTPGWTEVTNTTITALSATITELAEDTEYEVQVRATNDEGTSGWSDSDSASTAITNTPATGAPTITGTAQVGQTLTAGTTAIMDAEGLTSVSYTYQWIRVDGGTETNISGATASTYTLVAADQGTTIKVTVSFTDDASNAETLTSAATAAVSAAPNTPATGAPTITGTAQVGQTLTAGTTAIMDAEGLTNVSYTYQWIRVDGGTETNISGATARHLHAGGGRPGHDDQGEGELHRRRQQPRDADQRGDGGRHRHHRPDDGHVRSLLVHGHGGRRGGGGHGGAERGAVGIGDDSADDGAPERRHGGGPRRHSGDRDVRDQPDGDDVHGDGDRRRGHGRRRERATRVRDAAGRVRAGRPPHGDGDAGRRRCEPDRELRHGAPHHRQGARERHRVASVHFFPEHQPGRAAERQSAAAGDDPAGGDAPGRGDTGGLRGEGAADADERDVRGGPERDGLLYARDTGREERDRRGPAARLRPAAGGGAQGHLGAVRNDRVRGPGPARVHGVVRGRGVHGHGGRRPRAGVDPSERAGGNRAARCAAGGDARGRDGGGLRGHPEERAVRGGRADADDHGDGNRRYGRRRRRERDAVVRQCPQRPGARRHRAGLGDGGAGRQRRAQAGDGVVRGGDLHGERRRRRRDGARGTGRGARPLGDGAADEGAPGQRDGGGLLRHSDERDVRGEPDVADVRRDGDGRRRQRRRRERVDRVRDAAGGRVRGQPGSDDRDAGRRRRAEACGELRLEPGPHRPGARGRQAPSAQRAPGQQPAAAGDDPAGGDARGRRDGGGLRGHPGERDVRGGPDECALLRARTAGRGGQNRRGPAARLRPAAAGRAQGHMGAVRNDRLPGPGPDGAAARLRGLPPSNQWERLRPGQRRVRPGGAGGALQCN